MHANDLHLERAREHEARLLQLARPTLVLPSRPKQRTLRPRLLVYSYRSEAALARACGSARMWLRPFMALR